MWIHLVLKNLNLFDTRQLVEVAEEMLFMTDVDLKCIVTGDDILIYSYSHDTEIALQSNEYCAAGEPNPKKNHIKAGQKLRSC